jgi:hypothetical protein
MLRLSISLAAVLVSSAAPLAQTNDQCKQGYVWREAFAGDHVCVTPQVRQQAADDNRRDASHDPRRSDVCLAGFVWREASPTDHVCVTPANRDQTRTDNAVAHDRTDDEGFRRPVGRATIFKSGGAGSGTSGPPDVTVSWRGASHGSLPPNAVLGGWEKWEAQAGSTAVRTEGPLYICRASFHGAVYLGKVVNSACNFGAEGKEHMAGSYDVMTATSVHDSLGWRRSGSMPPPGAVAGGRSPAGHDVYMCRILYNGGIHPGWQVPGRDACSIGYGGEEVQRPGMSYLVLQKGKPIDD